MSLSRPRLELLFSLGLVLLSGWIVWEARDWPFRVKLFPWTIGLPVLALALYQLGQAVRAARAPAGSRGPGLDAEAALPLDAPGSAARLAQILAWVVAFFLGLWLMGFRVGAPLLMFAFLHFGARERPRVSLAMALGAYLFLVAGFELGLGVPLPRGQVATWLQVDWPDAALIEQVRAALAGS